MALSCTPVSPHSLPKLMPLEFSNDLTAAGKDSAQTQNDNTARNNVGDAYGGYNKKLFDPGNEPMKSIYARNDPDFTHKFWEATSVYYVKRSSGIIAMMTDLLPAALSAAKGGNGKPAIFVSSEVRSPIETLLTT